MKLKNLLTVDHVFNGIHADSKKNLFEVLSEKVAMIHPQINSLSIFEALIARERLGSTSIGHGVAIPHCRLESLNEPLGVLLILKKSIKFDTSEEEGVDIVFGLLVPTDATETHLKLLAEAAHFFEEASHRAALREAVHPQEIISLIDHHHG